MFHEFLAVVIAPMLLTAGIGIDHSGQTGRAQGPISAGGGSVLVDNFDDGDYTNNPAWTVWQGGFDATSQYLKNTQTGQSKIRTPHTGTVGAWEWDFRHNVTDSQAWAQRFMFMMPSITDPWNNAYMFISTNGNQLSLTKWSNGTVYQLRPGSWSQDTNWHKARVERGIGGGFAYYLDNILKEKWIIDREFDSSLTIGFQNEADSPSHWVGADNISFNPSTDAPPTVTVTSPNGGETWTVGQPYSITWTASQGTYPFMPAPIDIWISYNGSVGPWVAIASGLANTGSYAWTASGPATVNATIKVSARDSANATNFGDDQSNGYFTIIAVVPELTRWAGIVSIMIGAAVLLQVESLRVREPKSSRVNRNRGPALRRLEEKSPFSFPRWR